MIILATPLSWENDSREFPLPESGLLSDAIAEAVEVPDLFSLSLVDDRGRSLLSLDLEDVDPRRDPSDVFETLVEEALAPEPEEEDDDLDDVVLDSWPFDSWGVYSAEEVRITRCEIRAQEIAEAAIDDLAGDRASDAGLDEPTDEIRNEAMADMYSAALDSLLRGFDPWADTVPGRSI